MLRKTSISAIAALLMLGICVSFAKGQSDLGTFADRVQFQSGAALEFMPIRFVSTGNSFFRNAPLMYGIHFGMHYLLAQSNDMISLGVEPGINFSFQYDNVFGTSLLAQVPVYFIGRVGSRSTKFNENAVGFGLGVGGNFTYFNLPYSAGNGTYKLRPAFLAPAAMVELSINPSKSRGGAFTLRFHVNIIPYEADYSEAIPGVPTREKLEYNNFGVQLIYSFGG